MHSNDQFLSPDARLEQAEIYFKYFLDAIVGAGDCKA
jgi:hypothetical protein